MSRHDEYRPKENHSLDDVHYFVKWDFFIIEICFIQLFVNEWGVLSFNTVPFISRNYISVIHFRYLTMEKILPIKSEILFHFNYCGN